MGDNDTNRSQAPPNNNNSSPRSSRQTDDDPFVALRRFADENISSVLQSFMGLPSMITPPSTENWSIFANEHNYNNQRSRQSGDTSADSGEEGPIDAYRYYRSGFDGSPAMWRSDFDDFFPFGPRFMLPFQFSFDGGMGDRESWPLPFLMFSPYSPLNLERRPQCNTGAFSSLISSLGFSDNDNDNARDDAHEPRWKEAFEDLIRLENGKPMLDREPGAVSQRESGTNWLRGMIQRGSMGDNWILNQDDGHPNGISIIRRNQVPSSSEQPASDAETQQTEQDMYEQFLQGLEARRREAANESRTLFSLLEDRAGNFSRPFRSPWDEDFQAQRKSFFQNLDDIEASFLSGDASKDSPVPKTLQSSTSSTSSATEVHQDEPTPAVAQDQHRVISTHTNTNRVRMADGSIHTKTVKTQRFADGHEESNESVDVVNPLERQDPAAAAAGTDQESTENSGNGWFWKD